MTWHTKWCDIVNDITWLTKSPVTVHDLRHCYWQDMDNDIASDVTRLTTWLLTLHDQLHGMANNMTWPTSRNMGGRWPRYVCLQVSLATISTDRRPPMELQKSDTFVSNSWWDRGREGERYGEGEGARERETERERKGGGVLFQLFFLKLWLEWERNNTRIASFCSNNNCFKVHFLVCILTGVDVHYAHG